MTSSLLSAAWNRGQTRVRHTETLLSAASAAALLLAMTTASALAQQQSATQEELPPLVVEGQSSKKSTKKAQAKAKTSPTPQSYAAPLAVQPGSSSGIEKANGPVNGYVAKQTATGTKTDTPIAKVPQSIAVVPKDQMEDQRVGSVAEALRYTPGVFTDYRGASNLKDEMFVRGFYYVPRYLDGTYLAGDLSYAKIDPYLLERIELLSGPSSVLYGQGNPGGIVNMVSKKPTLVPLHEVQLTFGSDKQLGLAFDISDKVAGSNQLSYRVTGSGFGRDLQEDFAEQRSYAIAPSLMWRPDTSTELTLHGGYQNEPDMGFRNFLDAAGTLTPISGYGYIPRSFFVSDPNFEKAEREQYWGGYEFEHAFSDTLTVRQNVRLHHVDHEHHTLTYGSLSGTSISRRASGGTESWDTVSIDNQVQAKVQTGIAKHTLLAGLDYLHRTRDYQWGYGAATSIDLANPQYGHGPITLSPDSDQKLEAEQTGVYVQDQIDIGRFSFTAGARYDWASTDIDDKIGTNDQSYDDTAFTWRVGALYTFDNGLAPYVSYATSFDPSLSLPPAGVSAFDPTTAEQYEIGVKYAPKGTSTLLTAAYYDLTQENVVMTDYSGGWPGVNRQVGEIHNKGIELSARTDITQNLSLIASYAHIKSEITDTVSASELGKMPARIPKDQAALWTKYSFSDAVFLRGTTIGAGARYVGQSWGNNANTFEVPDVTLFDAMVKYDFGALDHNWDGLELQLNVKNIADETYVASCASAYACFYGEGRVVTGTLTYRW
ncbi:TonB-dependent siderophore receptor [Hyphomicrobium sp. LHD-15]|uniref:TonB-dependent siderophore receptor n=1 Tax=Hyphomicrobium sp. LHD-15 TaxID=3072142 RepID=UPI00280EA33B|nr:TonB-dependent siderophore receptor [Hyphomicrobium sp. LHD-15]MDQ8697603.1 TonB-dependent siderophore receptor [Hyphomicrobium sp. LHD-15]